MAHRPARQTGGREQACWLPGPVVRTRLSCLYLSRVFKGFLQNELVRLTHRLSAYPKAASIRRENAPLDAGSPALFRALPPPTHGRLSR